VTAIAAPGVPEDDDVLVLGDALCRCGRRAEVVVSIDDASAWCSIRCDCGAFAPGDGQECAR
jgi:hypothetical protein